MAQDKSLVAKLTELLLRYNKSVTIEHIQTLNYKESVTKTIMTRVIDSK